MNHHEKNTKKKTPPTIEARISKLRKSNGLTQEGLGLKLNVSKSTISRYETGAIRVPSDVIETLAKLFHVTPYFIQFGETSCVDENTIDISRLTFSDRKLVRDIVERLDRRD